MKAVPFVSDIEIIPTGFQCGYVENVPYLVMKAMALGRGKPKDAYDESVLELVSVDSLLENTLYTNVEGTDAIVGVQNAFSSDEKVDVVKYTFKLKEGVDVDEVSVTLTQADTVNVTNGDAITSEDIESTIIAGTATTKIYSYEKASDINKDGDVTLADLSVALAYYQTTEVICDINLDGVVNAADYVIITSFIER